MMGVSNPTTITPQGVAMKGNCCNCSAFVKATSILHRASKSIIHFSNGQCLIHVRTSLNKTVSQLNFAN